MAWHPLGMKCAIPLTAEFDPSQRGIVVPFLKRGARWISRRSVKTSQFATAADHRGHHNFRLPTPPLADRPTSSLLAALPADKWPITGSKVVRQVTCLCGVINRRVSVQVCGRSKTSTYGSSTPLQNRYVTVIVGTLPTLPVITHSRPGPRATSSLAVETTSAP